MKNAISYYFILFFWKARQDLDRFLQGMRSEARAGMTPRNNLSETRVRW